jgi:hypothetical protein
MVNQSAGTFSVTVQLSAASSLAVSVPFTLGGTAASGTDYSGLTASPLTIPAGSTSGTISGTLLPDYGAGQTLTFTLGTPTNGTLGATTTNTLTITEPQPTVQFAAASETVDESAGTFSVTLQLSNASDQDVTVPFTPGGTAASGTDYSGLTASPLTIPAGSTTATISGTLLPDYGQNQTLTFTLGTPANATLGATTANTLTTTEPQPAVQFTTAGEVVNQTAGTFSVRVNLRNASNQDVTVPFTLGGSAVSGTDYSGLTASPLTIPAGQTSATISGTLYPDYGASQTLTFALGTPTNATLGGSTTNTLTITEPRPAVQFTAANEVVNESAGTFSVTVQLSNASNQDVIVPFTTAGTAVSGTDYSGLTASPVTIPARGTTATITGTLLPDDGSSQTLTFTLGTPTNATLGATTLNTLTITEPSPPPPPAPVGRVLAVSGQASGTASIFTPSAGHYSDPPTATTPAGLFGGFAGEVRVATGDVNGDGVPDTIMVTGPGTPTRMAVVSGKDGSVLVPPTDPFGDPNFSSGAYVTAGDIAGTGRADWVVTPALTGGPRVVIFQLLANGAFDITSAGQPSLVANFFGIGDPGFRDGDRAALGDVNGDGILDVFSIAAFNGGPRTALYDGKDVLTAKTAGRDPVKLTGDFFAAVSGQDEGRGGRSIAAGDVNGDGLADLIVTGDNLLGTGNEVVVFSGADLAAGKVPGFGAAPLADFAVSGQPGGALVSVAAVDADGDTKADLVVGSGAGQPSLVRVYLGKEVAPGGEPAATDLDPFGGAVLAGGVFVG